MAEKASAEDIALAKMRGLVFGFSITRSIAAAAELGIADRLADGPRAPRELARDCGVLERPLYRMLRALAGEGFLLRTKMGVFHSPPWPSCFARTILDLCATGPCLWPIFRIELRWR